MKCLPLLFLAAVACAAPPNILWITIEDTSPQFLGCYGNPHARTPVIDRLAREGVRFVNAFSTGAVCSPSRFTLITGIPTYQAGTGHHRSACPIPATLTGFPAFLRKAGYYTTNNFKTDYNLADSQRLIAESWDESSRQAGWWNRRPGQPFFAVFNFMESHQSRTMTDPYPKYEADVLGQLTADERIGDHDFELPPFYRDSPEMRRQVARTYNALKLTDKRIGALLERLRRDGLEENTIVFFFSDHGAGIPRAKTNGIGLGYRVPMVLRFPPRYQFLSPWEMGTVSEELVGFEDLAPTVLHLAGATAPAYLQGRVLLGYHRAPPPEFIFASSDRSDESTDLVRSVTNGRYLYSRNFLPFMPETRWIRYQEISAIKQAMRQDFSAGRLNRAQSRMFGPRPAEYLFDLRSDPWELHNLADDPESAALLEKMRGALDANILQSRDIHFLPEYEMARATATSTPYEYRLDRVRYPLEEIYAAARLAGQRSEAAAGQQLKFLKSPHDLVRYWAILGLKSQPPAWLKAHALELTPALRDAYAPAQIIAAALLAEHGEGEEAGNLLRQHALDANDHLALLALQHIACLPDPAPFAPIIEQVWAKGGENHADLHDAAAVLLARLGLQSWENPP